MTDAELKAIQERADKATRGPWLSHDTLQGEWGVSLPNDGTVSVWGLYFGDMETNTGQDIANADFVAHARNDIPALLDALEAAQRECAAQYVKGWNDGEADAERLRVERDDALAALRELTAVLRVNWPESTATAEFKKAQQLLIESGAHVVRRLNV